MMSLHKIARFQLGYHNLLERDLDHVHVFGLQPICVISFIQKLNIMVLFDMVEKILARNYRLSHNFFVTLRLAKYLFPRDLDESSTVLGTYGLQIRVSQFYVESIRFSSVDMSLRV